VGYQDRCQTIRRLSRSLCDLARVFAHSLRKMGHAQSSALIDPLCCTSDEAAHISHQSKTMNGPSPEKSSPSRMTFTHPRFYSGPTNDSHTAEQEDANAGKEQIPQAHFVSTQAHMAAKAKDAQMSQVLNVRGIKTTAQQNRDSLQQARTISSHSNVDSAHGFAAHRLPVGHAFDPLLSEGTSRELFQNPLQQNPERQIRADGLLGPMIPGVTISGHSELAENHIHASSLRADAGEQDSRR
jgi:hypothetical protein